MDKYSNCSSSYNDRIDRSTTDTGLSTLSTDSFWYSRTSSEASDFSIPNDRNSTSDEPVGWPIAKSEVCDKEILSKLGIKQSSDDQYDKYDEEVTNSELEMMKEKFSKLLLGEDMSGSGKGVCTAVAISNAITNLYATIFGQFRRLEPLAPEKKSMWRREMECLLSVCDYIVDFVPSSQNYPDGKILEFQVMTNKPRSDIYINLPALHKLETMLLEILDSFRDPEFWYVDQGCLSSISHKSGSFRQVIQRKEEKWWLPVPYVPPCGLSDKSRKQLRHKRDCANQILKAAVTINGSVLGEMEVPETYLGALPKSGKASLGDSLYRYISSTDQFSPEHLLDCLNITSEHEALEIADRVEASMYIWRRKAAMNNLKSSWGGMVKDLMADGDKNEVLSGRAESLLLCLKQRYPELSQTTLDTCKIQYNKDVGQSILESYSRVLESLAFNIVSWIDDVLYVDGSLKHPDP